MRRIAPEVEQGIVAAWQDGAKSTTRVAEAFNVGTSTVRMVLQRNGLGAVPRGYRDKRTDAAQDALILLRYAEGSSASEIGIEFGLSRASVLNRVHAAGIQPRVRGGGVKPLSTEQVNEALRLRDSGMGVVRIARELGIAFPRVRRCLAENGKPTWNTTQRKQFHRHAHGYIWEAIEPGDPFACMATERGYVLQHRLVVARDLDRPLERHETVHHINGVRSDNRRANLQLRQGKHGKGAAFQCLDCGSHNVEAMPLN